MDGLMELLIAELAGVFPDMRRNEVYILPNPGILPEGRKYPFIGLKDGRMKTSELSGGVEEIILPMEIYYFDKLKSGNKYLLEFLKRRKLIRQKLKNNKLGGYVQGVSPTSETPITLIAPFDKNRRTLVLRKGLFYQYEREE